jgi:gamma-glutamylcyclotransferase (GGCT)/AIG2-like uncharacterized protein YtfP
LTLYFAYGSNMASKEMDDWCPEHRFLGPARLEDHRLELRRRSRRWKGGAADIVRAPREVVWGALYELPNGKLDALDPKEGVGFAYRRRELEVLIDDEPRKAFAYEVIEKEPEEVPPTRAYTEQMVNGARERGLPEGYVRTLRKRLTLLLASPGS